MRGKNTSMDGLYLDRERGRMVASNRVLGLPFYASGERFENLPAGGFAGTPNQTMVCDPFSFEYATGSSGQFGRRAMRHAVGSTMVGMGFDLSDITGAINDVQSVADQVSDVTSQAQDVYSQVQQVIAPQQQQASAPAPAPAPSVIPAAVSQTAKKITSYKIMGIPVVVLVAAAAAGLFVYSQAKKKK